MPRKCKSDPTEPTLKERVLGIVKKVAGKYICDAHPECLYSQATLVPHNFARHIGALHPEIYNLLDLGEPLSEEEIVKRKSKTPTKESQQDDHAMVKISKRRLLGGIVKMVTIHHQALNILNWDGFRDVIDPLLDAFGIHVNNKNIAEYVCRVRTEIDGIIKSEVQNQMVSIKFDPTTKRYKSVLGVNVQFFKGTTHVKRTLGK